MGCADRDGRWCGAARQHFSPGRRPASSRGTESRPLRQGSGVPGRLSRRVESDDRALPGSGRGLVESLPGVGGLRSGEVGARRLCLRSGRRPRMGPVTGFPRSLEPSRNDRHARLHRVGGHPAVEQRQGRPARHQLLRRQPMAGRRDEPPSSRGDHPVGGLLGLLPRALLPRRYRQRHEVGLVRAHRHHGAARSRRARLRQRQHRRSGRGTRDTHLSSNCRPRGPTFPPRSTRTASTTNSTASGPHTSTRSPCRCCPQEIGAGRRCICAATWRASCGPPRARSGWRFTASNTGPSSTPTTELVCRSDFSTTSSTAPTTDGTASHRSC